MQFGRMVGASDQLEFGRKKSKKEKGKALVESKFILPSGKKSSKRVCRTKEQMVADALVKVVELTMKASCTPSQELLKFMGIIREGEE
jgi:hypothetical protein